MKIKAIFNGIIGIGALLGLYFAVVSLISGWQFAQAQFWQFWYFIIALAVGFGIQIGLYSHLRQIVQGSAGKGMVTATGVTSTIAMISCCAHYLANILPIIAISGIPAFVGQYQVELFWVGLLFNAFGIFYIGRKVSAFKSQTV